MSIFEVLGVAGIAISVLAYVPQVIHLGRERCSAGVSRRAWAMWLTSSVLIGTLALYRRDLVFILLQVSTLTSAAIILFLATKYRGMVCAFHAHGFSGHGALVTTTAGELIAEALAATAERFDILASLPSKPFPGGRWLRRPLATLGLLYYALKDRLG